MERSCLTVEVGEISRLVLIQTSVYFTLPRATSRAKSHYSGQALLKQSVCQMADPTISLSDS